MTPTYYLFSSIYLPLMSRHKDTEQLGWLQRRQQRLRVYGADAAKVSPTQGWLAGPGDQCH